MRVDTVPSECILYEIALILPECLFPPRMLLAALKQVKSKLTLQIEKMSVKSRGNQTLEPIN